MNISLRDSDKFFFFIVGLVMFCFLLLFGIFRLNSDVQNRDLQIKELDYQIQNAKDPAINDSYEIRYLKKCLDNIDRFYNDSIRKVKFSGMCLREFATLNNVRISNCLDFNFANGTTTTWCGFSRTTVEMDKMNKLEVLNVTFYERFKKRKSD